MNNTLIFEGAGMNFEPNELSDVGNYRIRTILMNDKGQLIYIELVGHKNTGYLVDNMEMFEFPFHISHCFDLVFQKSNNDPKLRSVERLHGEYKKKEILKLINNKLNCSFTDMIVDCKHDGFSFKSRLKDNYEGFLKAHKGKEITVCEVLPCDEGDSAYWVRIKEESEAHLIKSKHLVGF